MFTLRVLGSAAIDGPSGPVTGRGAMRQRVALLALLAVEHPRPLSRDRLLAYLWPESSTADARHLLRESLYILRSTLGDDSVLSVGDDVRLNPDRLSCDLWEFESALARDELEAAMDLYHGPFMSGFHLSEAEEFERWVDGERSRAARRYSQALEQLAERQGEAGNAVSAAGWWSRLAAEDPYNSRIALRYMQALEASGDRAAALRHASAHSELLRTELDAVPEREIVALADKLRAESRAASPGAPVVSQHRSEEPSSLPASANPAPVRSTRRTWLPTAVLLLVVFVGLGLVGGVLSRERPPELSSNRVAAAVFENRTGRPDLDDLGPMAADWILRGVMETPLVDAPELEAVYAGPPSRRSAHTDPRAEAQNTGAGLVVRGSYYLSGDSVLFQASIMDVASGRVLRALEPTGASLERATAALEALRERIVYGLAPLVDPLKGYMPVDPNLVPPSLSAYREFIAGLKEGDREARSDHLRRAAELDTTFVAPLIQLAFDGVDVDCAITDSIGTVLDRRRERLTPWNRITIDVLRARCHGPWTKTLQLLKLRFEAYPQSELARGTYGMTLQASNQPRAAYEVLRELESIEEGYRPWYSWRLAATHHMLGHYRTELDITDQWRDSTAWEWQVIRGRALAALGREREAMELVWRTSGVSVDSVADHHLEIATELVVHGHPAAGRAVAESILTRLELAPGPGWRHTEHIALANRILGRPGPEREALERLIGSDADTIPMMEAQARIAVLLGDTVRAGRIDSLLAKQDEGSLDVARAQIAAGFGRLDEAVARLQEAKARHLLRLGSSHAFHEDLLLAPLRGYPPFEALLKPDN